jgi:hypothetical protein
LEAGSLPPPPPRLILQYSTGLVDLGPLHSFHQRTLPLTNYRPSLYPSQAASGSLGSRITSQTDIGGVETEIQYAALAAEGYGTGVDSGYVRMTNCQLVAYRLLSSYADSRRTDRAAGINPLDWLSYNADRLNVSVRNTSLLPIDIKELCITFAKDLPIYQASIIPSPS